MKASFSALVTNDINVYTPTVYDRGPTSEARAQATQNCLAVYQQC